MAPDPPREQFGDHYRSIYLAGAGGEQPTLPVDWRELEARAAAVLDERAGGYVFGSAGTGFCASAAAVSFARKSASVVP